MYISRSDIVLNDVRHNGSFWPDTLHVQYQDSFWNSTRQAVNGHSWGSFWFNHNNGTGKVNHLMPWITAPKNNDALQSIFLRILTLVEFEQIKWSSDIKILTPWHPTMFIFFSARWSPGLSQYRIWTSGNDLALENDWRWAVPGNPRMTYFNWSPGNGSSKKSVSWTKPPREVRVFA